MELNSFKIYVGQGGAQHLEQCGYAGLLWTNSKKWVYPSDLGA